MNNPFPGPRAFTEEDHAAFFGRDRELDDLLTLVLLERVILVHGASGTGKSSLVRAGLVPRARAEGFDVLPIARVRLPGAALATDDDRYNRFVDNVVTNWRSDPRFADAPGRTSLGATLASLGPSPEPGRLMVFDQFEELFVVHPERWKDRADFFRQVQQALDDDPLLRVLIVLRDDYLARLERYAPLLRNRFGARYALDGLDRSQAVEASVGPFELAGLSLDQDAAELLVDMLLHVPAEGVEGPYERERVEPLQLQIVCSEFFDVVSNRSAASKSISRQDVASQVDVNRALSRFYDSAVGTAVKRHRTVSERRARLWLERKLVTNDRSRNLVRRGEQKTEGLPNDVVDDLSRLGVLHEEPRGRHRWYELSHDRLVDAVLSSNRAWLRARNRRRNMLAGLLSGIGAAALIAVVFLGGIDVSGTAGPTDHPDTISQPGQVIPFPFEGERGQLVTAVLFIDGNSDLNGHVRLVDPDGRVVAESKEGFRRPSLSASLESSGRYRLNVSGLDGTTGQFSLNIRIERTGARSTTVRPGTPEGGTLARPEEVDRFQFEGRKGTVALITVVAPRVDSFLTLATPGTDHLFIDSGAGNRDAGLAVQLPDDGTYEARVSSLGRGKGAYTLDVEFVQPSELGDSLTDTLSERNRVDVFSVKSDIDGLRTIQLRSDGEPPGSMRLFSPGGERLVRSRAGDPGNPEFSYPLAAGASYLLTVAGNGKNLGSYHLTARTLAARDLAPPGASGQLGPLHTVDLYRVGGEAGATFTLRAVPSDALNVSIELFLPDGIRFESRDRAGAGQEEFFGDRFPATGVYMVKVSTSSRSISARYDLDYLVSGPSRAPT